MEAWWLPILVAVIGGPIVAMIQRFDRRNTEQHGENLKALSRIEEKVDKLDDRLYDHIQDHN